jgi:hypothetical protein
LDLKDENKIVILLNLKKVWVDQGRTKKKEEKEERPSNVRKTVVTLRCNKCK